MVIVKGQELVDRVRKIGLASKDYIYDSMEATLDLSGCRYEDLGMGSCVVGRALNCLGVPASALTRMDWKTNSQINVLVENNDVLGVEFEDFTEEHLIWLANVQFRQDARFNWGHSIRLADEATSLPQDW